ncbi:hypothetical protein C5167_044474 [Papaver somniferum]|uniref:F-box/LRR-repeat protein 15/At3g58940/PEG3-like LRR domain-containing protein n=1 Tax=Papaver somniferum TaxID=3469 RepID=A0A4Y7LBK1_PAPSO|nr:hypothetical protein C5167_044474 [Papaver somniferum]
MDFVDRTLLLHDESNIQKFKLNLYSDMNASRVHSWIENVTRRNAEELSLDLSIPKGDLPLSIPLSLFNCESLTKLKLTASPSMCFPKKIFFPKLKSLTLWSIKFGDGCWNEQPFSNCLVLEELFLYHCTWFGMTQFCISTPALKVLEINNELDEEETGLEGCDLKIHAPSLVSLSCRRGCVAKDYELSSFSTLDEAVVEFVFSDHESRRPENMSQVVSKFIQALSHVRYLSLHVAKDKVLSVANGFVSNPPTYHNLTALRLRQGATVDTLIFGLLRAAPNLRDLFDCWSSHDEIEYDETEDLFRHLQSVRFLESFGKERELRWAMTYGFSFFVSNEKTKESVRSELPSLPRASARCVVKFV